MLIPPAFDLSFIVHTDAYEVGLGVVLSQEPGGEEHPVMYVSGKYPPRAYSMEEKEDLAIKWAPGKLEYHLLC